MGAGHKYMVEGLSFITMTASYNCRVVKWLFLDNISMPKTLYYC